MLSGERIAELEWRWGEETSDEESQEWRDHLSEEEAEFVEQWDKGYAHGLVRLCADLMEAGKRNDS